MHEPDDTSPVDAPGGLDVSFLMTIGGDGTAFSAHRIDRACGDRLV